MSIIRRPGCDSWYTKFTLNGKQHYRSTGTTDKVLAGIFENDLRKEILIGTPADKAPVLVETAHAPGLSLGEYAQPPDGLWWTGHATSAYQSKPNTLRFFRDRIQSLLLYAQLADAQLDAIDMKLIQAYVNFRRNAVKGATINRDLAVLRIVLNTAQDMDLISTVPAFRKFKQKERKVGRVLSVEEEAVYLSAVDEDQHDYTLILVETAMEPGPCASLAWSDVHFDETGKYAHGYIYDRCTKAETRERPLVMTSRLAVRLRARWEAAGQPQEGYVFPSVKRRLTTPKPLGTFQSVHKRLWRKTPHHEPLAIPRFRLYDLRHTALTRARDAGADMFDLMQMAGWSSPAMAQVYIKVDDRSRAKNAERTAGYMEEQRRQAGITG